MSDDNKKTFVYKGKEYTLTGRTAKKAVFHQRDVNRKIGTMTIVEVAPNGPLGSDPEFHEWVDPRELFFISEMEEINLEDVRKNNEALDG